MQTHSNQSTTSRVFVYGAAGHTARFVVAALERRGHRLILAGRDGAQLRAAHPLRPSADFRVVALADADSLHAALREVDIVVNCAGPFAETAPTLVPAAIRAGAHYIDITAEQTVALTAFEHWAAAASDRGVSVLPAVGFYGGLGDLLATAAMGDWDHADAVDIGIALDSWHPTLGTRKTVKRNAGRHFVFVDHQFQPSPSEPARRRWQFADAFGELDMVGLSLADAVTISSHLNVDAIRAFINEVPIRDLQDQNTPAPEAVDDIGRSAQRFTMEVVVARKDERRGASASGQDIYSITAPLVAEAANRLGIGVKSGVHALGSLFDPDDFLRSMAHELRVLRTDKPLA